MASNALQALTGEGASLFGTRKAGATLEGSLPSVNDHSVYCRKSREQIGVADERKSVARQVTSCWLIAGRSSAAGSRSRMGLGPTRKGHLLKVDEWSSQRDRDGNSCRRLVT